MKKMAGTSTRRNGATAKGSHANSRRRKKGHDLARVIVNGDDVTPKSLFDASKHKGEHQDIEAVTAPTNMDLTGSAEENGAQGVSSRREASNDGEQSIVSVKKVVADERWRNTMISVKIAETETHTCLFLPSLQVWDEDEGD